MNIDSKQMLAGVSVIRIRTFLREYQQFDLYADAFEAAFPSSGQSILNALRDEGYVEPSERPGLYKVTTKGGALANASAAPPISRKTADRCLREFLARVETVRDSPEFLWKVKRVVLFGSYLTTDKQAVSDVDLAIELVPKEKDPRTRMALEEVQIEKAIRAGRRFPTFLDRLGYPEIQVRRFLKSRSRALQFTSPHDAVIEAAAHKVIYEDLDE
jgi:predicted nucleotidyltransferase